MDSGPNLFLLLALTVVKCDNNKDGSDVSIMKPALILPLFILFLVSLFVCHVACFPHWNASIQYVTIHSADHSLAYTADIKNECT
jgi:hypothetical protein